MINSTFRRSCCLAANALPAVSNRARAKRDRYIIEFGLTNGACHWAHQRHDRCGASCYFLSTPSSSKLRDDIFAVSTRFDLLVNVQDLAVLSNIVGPAIRQSSRTQAAESGGDGFVWIAKNRIVKIQALCKLGVFFDRVTTGSEVSDVEFAQSFAALTERLAFLRSSPGKGFGVPGDHKRLFAFELFVCVRLSVASDHLEIRDVVTNADFCISLFGHERKCS